MPLHKRVTVPIVKKDSRLYTKLASKRASKRYVFHYYNEETQDYLCNRDVPMVIDVLTPDEEVQILKEIAITSEYDVRAMKICSHCLTIKSNTNV